MERESATPARQENAPFDETKRVTMSRELFDLLDLQGTDSEDWQQFLESNELQPGHYYEMTIVDDDGTTETGVYSTEASDHLTRDRELSAARRIIEASTDVSDIPPHAAVIDDIGDEALDGAGIENPTEEARDRLISEVDDAQVAEVLARNAIDGAVVIGELLVQKIESDDHTLRGQMHLTEDFKETVVALNLPLQNDGEQAYELREQAEAVGLATDLQESVKQLLTKATERADADTREVYGLAERLDEVIAIFMQQEVSPLPIVIEVVDQLKRLRDNRDDMQVAARILNELQ